MNVFSEYISVCTSSGSWREIVSQKVPSTECLLCFPISSINDGLESFIIKEIVMDTIIDIRPHLCLAPCSPHQYNVHKHEGVHYGRLG